MDRGPVVGLTDGGIPTADGITPRIRVFCRFTVGEHGEPRRREPVEGGTCGGFHVECRIEAGCRLVGNETGHPAAIFHCRLGRIEHPGDVMCRLRHENLRFTGHGERPPAMRSEIVEADVGCVTGGRQCLPSGDGIPS